MVVRRLYIIVGKDIDGQIFRLQLTEKGMQALQKAGNLILNNHGPLANHVEVDGVSAVMEEK